MPGLTRPEHDTSCTILCGGFHRCDPQWDKPADGIDQCYKLYFVMRGEGRLMLRNQPDETLCADRAYFIPGYRLLGQACPRQMEVYWLHFIPDSLYLSFLLSHVPRVHSWSLESLACWRSTFLEIPRLFPRPLLALRFRIQSLLLQLLAHVLESYNFAHMAAVDPVIEQLRPAIAHMDQRAVESPRLADIARVVHLAPNYFHRRFTRTFHVTPLAYMMQQRLNRVRQLLLGTDLTLEQIAARTGFHSPFYLSRTFSKRYQTSPSEFRRRFVP